MPHPSRNGLSYFLHWFLSDLDYSFSLPIPHAESSNRSKYKDDDYCQVWLAVWVYYQIEINDKPFQQCNRDNYRRQIILPCHMVSAFFCFLKPFAMQNIRQ